MVGYQKRFWVLAAGLAALAGYVDALGFVRLGGYFVSFMSGNSTRLAVGLAMNWTAAAIAGRLIAAFVAGVVLGALVAAWAGPRRKPAVLALVAAILALAALGIWPSIALAMAMGAANDVFQRNGEVSVGVTYMTGTLVKLGQHLAQALSGGARWGWVPYLMLWCSLTGGAVGGALAEVRLGQAAIALAVAAAGGLAVYAAAIGSA
jgi:uncharacterized membrane protein YoaK (UPF0700 family)